MVELAVEKGRNTSQTLFMCPALYGAVAALADPFAYTRLGMKAYGNADGQLVSEAHGTADV